MIDKINILSTLRKLETEFSNSLSDADLPIFFSKLAVMELCGWIELSYDIILKDYIDRHIVDNQCKKIINGFIKKNNGFAYETNTFQIFSIVLGANNWENILDRLGDLNQSNLKSKLEEYSNLRNKAAHTNIKGTQMTYKSPSDVINDFNLVLPALQVIETEVHNL